MGWSGLRPLSLGRNNMVASGAQAENCLSVVNNREVAGPGSGERARPPAPPPSRHDPGGDTERQGERGGGGEGGGEGGGWSYSGPLN